MLKTLDVPVHFYSVSDGSTEPLIKWLAGRAPAASYRETATCLAVGAVAALPSGIILEQNLNDITCSRPARNTHRSLAVLGARVHLCSGLEERLCAHGQVVGCHTMQWPVAIGVLRLDFSTPRDEILCHVLISAAHSRHVKRLCTARGNFAHLKERARARQSGIESAQAQPR